MHTTLAQHLLCHCFLMVGPSFSMLRSFFNAWRSTNTWNPDSVPHGAPEMCSWTSAALLVWLCPQVPDLSNISFREPLGPGPRACHREASGSVLRSQVSRFYPKSQSHHPILQRAAGLTSCVVLTVQSFGANVRLITPRARFHILSGGAGVGDGLSGRELHVRILPRSFPPAVIPRQGGRSDGGPACATVSCEFPILQPTRILSLGCRNG